MSRKSGLFLLALKQAARAPFRSLASAVAISALTASLFTISLVYFSVSGALKASMDRLGADAMAVPAQKTEIARGVLLAGSPSEFYMDESIAEKIASIPGVSAVSKRLFVVSAPLACCSISDTMLIGYEPGTDFTIAPWVRERLSAPLKDNHVIAGSRIENWPGGRVKFYGSEFVIAGKLAPTGMDFIDASVFIPMEGARKMIKLAETEAEKTLDIPDGAISSVMIDFKEDTDPLRAALMIESRLEGVNVIVAASLVKTAKRGLMLPLKAATGVTAIMWAVSLLLAAVVFSMSVKERRRDIGVMRALGARARDMVFLFVSEMMIVSLAGWAFGILAGGFFIITFDSLLKTGLGLPFLLPGWEGFLSAALITLALCLLSGALAAFWPSMKAASESPHEASQPK